MALFEQSTTVDRIEILSNGVVQVQMLKQVTKGGVIISSQYHRTSLSRGDDADAHLLALNAALIAEGSAEITHSAWKAVTAQCATAWASA